MTNGRKQFLQTVTKLAKQDPRVIIIIGDVGFSYLEGYMQKFPNQFLNTGACEQTMMNVAAGMAREGWKPYVYTMINFIVFRPYEQVRNNIAYSNANVKLIGVEGSEAYKFLGYSHNIYETETHQNFHEDKMEDQKLLEHLPNMNVYVPKTEDEVKNILLEEYDRKGPAYIRI